MFTSVPRRALAPAACLCAAAIGPRTFEPRTYSGNEGGKQQRNRIPGAVECQPLPSWVPFFGRPHPSKFFAEWTAGLSEGRDLSNSKEVFMLQELADKIVSSGVDVEQLKNIVYPKSTEYPSNFISAIALADSALKMKASGKPFHLTVVHAMFGEKARMSSRSSENPDGQDFVRMKVAQMNWLMDKYAPKGSTWSYIACDDGCPEFSGKLMEEVIKKEGYKNVSVVYLQDGIDNKTPPFNLLNNTKESRKGGACMYGLYAATKQAIPVGTRHLVSYFDADLSADLGLCGSLTYPILQGGHKVSVGQRYGVAGSFLVLEKADGHPRSLWKNTDCHKMVFRHFARSVLMPPLSKIKDTQCAFKAIEADKLPEIIPQMTAFGPTFDMQLLILSAQAYAKEKAPLEPVPFPFIEDKEGSTMTSTDDKALENFWKMLKEMVKIHDACYSNLTFTEEEKKWIQLFRDIPLDGYKAVIAAMQAKYGANPPDALDTKLCLGEVKGWAKMQ